MEMADVFVINKADGDNINRAKLAKTEFNRAAYVSCEIQVGSPQFQLVARLPRGIKRRLEYNFPVPRKHKIKYYFFDSL
jgi:putative protein kinase ArgK-like GTPase of G3E family